MSKINIKKIDLNQKHNAFSVSDYFAKIICMILRWTADFFLKNVMGIGP